MFVYPPICRLVREELAENDAMTQYANASASVVNARRRQNAVNSLIQEGWRPWNGGLVQVEEFEDPVEDPELNRVQAEMQAAIALLNAPQNLPEEEEEEAVNLPGAQTPPQTPSQAPSQTPSHWDVWR